jgi:nucleotide-binding universal stress UspA family protein
VASPDVPGSPTTEAGRALVADWPDFHGGDRTMTANEKRQARELVLAIEQQAAAAALRELFDECGLVFGDERVSYVEVQMDRGVWLNLAALAERGGEPK